MADSRRSKFYRIYFHGDQIQTLVTSSSSAVDEWISKIYHLHRYRLDNLIVGLDTEWHPSFDPETSNPIAIIQICVGHRCLVFQYLHADAIPISLIKFLDNKSFTFVGVGVEGDAEKLMTDCGLRVSCTVDVADMAANKYNDSGLKRLGLKRLALKLTGKWMKKPKRITLSNWGDKQLSYAQVEYACVDAYVSFLLGIQTLKKDKPASIPCVAGFSDPSRLRMDTLQIHCAVTTNSV